MIGQVELAFRVAAGLFVIVAPTLLFLGLWRGLEVLQDDELVECARAGEFDSTSSSNTPHGFATTVLPDSNDAVTCEGCGTPNLTDATYCQECLGKLSSP
jgi:hypothetical protein